MKTELLRERYEPLEVVGSGGEGQVMKALDHLHGRHVALKIRSVADEASRSQLLSEARLLLSLSPHPGLPLVREDFFVDDRYVIAMDWIEGTDLEALLRREGRPGLDPALAIGYLEQAAEALAHLHGHEPPIVHGDVKPANLILATSGRIVLVDFGLSSMPTDDPRRAGTAGYVAPEVAAGERPTAASDVFSLAATALALLTGDPPSPGAPSWGLIARERIPALERIVGQNLAADPTRRDASAAALVARLARWWGAAPPTGRVTLVLAEVDNGSARSAEASVDEVARAHRGHCVAPSDDGPLLAAFASALDGFDAARELAGAFDARVAVVTGEAEPRAGSYAGDAVTAAAGLLEVTGRGRVLLDDATADAIDGRLPRELGLAEVPIAAGSPAWTLVAPELALPPLAATCPYRGLIAFEPEDGELYFGRKEVVASILAVTLEDAFVAVVGASGSGKSSLVRAGLAPAYRRARAGPVSVITPGSDPLVELERLLSAGTPSLLIVDQLEEVFTLCPDEAARTAFIDAVFDLLEAGSTSVVVALRADFYGRCANHPRLAAALAGRQHLLGPMRLDELRSAIEGPARRAGLRLEPGLVDAMLADVAGEPGGLPLLSHVLYESWARRDGRVLTLAGYREAGGVRGAIAQTAEEIFLGRSEQERALMRRMFLQLTELGEGTEDTRRRVPLAQLFPDGARRAEGEAVVERLTQARLLVVDDDSAEIAHEALIREWPRLRVWLAEDRDELLALRRLTASARTWEEAGRNEADLYRGPRLAAAAELVGDERQPLSPLEREFLAAGRGAQNSELQRARRRARRLRALLVVVVAALVAAVIAGGFALVQRGRARRTAIVAEAGRLAAQSREVAGRQPDLGLLLALEADRIDDSVDSRSALLEALEHVSRIRAWLQGFHSPVDATAFSPDGRLLATVTHDGTTLWSTATWRPVAPPLRSRQGGWEGGGFSPDGRTLAIAGGKGRVELWDVASRKELRELTSPGAGALASVQFSPDGSVVATGSQEANRVTLWNVATGRVIGRPITVKPPGTGGAQWISFTPDSRRIAADGVRGTVGIWDVATGRRVGKPLAIGSEDVGDAIFATGGRTLIAGDDAGFVSFVDVRTGRKTRQPLSVGDKAVDALALSRDERLVAAASLAGPVHVWDAKTGTPYGSPLTADTSPGNDVAFSPDGRTLVSAHLRSAVVWNMDGEHVLGRPLGGPADLTTDVSFSPDGTRVAAGQFDGDTFVYDATTLRRVLRIEGGSAVAAVAFAPGGRLVAVGTIDGKVRFFDAKTGAVVGRSLDEGSLPVWQIAFSPDGRLLAAAVDPNGAGPGFDLQRKRGEVQLWDVASRRRVGRLIAPGRGSLLSVAFSRDGTLLATGGRGRLDLWNVADRARSGTPLTVADDGFLSVSFDPSGKLVGAGGAGGLVRVWRVADRRPAFPALPGNSLLVSGTSFDARGAFLATTSLLGATRLWDAATGVGYGDDLISEKPGSFEPAGDLPPLLVRNAFSPDGTRLATAGVASRAMLWDVDPAVWRRRACAVVGRNLHREEWKLYLPSGTRYRATCPEWPTG